MRLFAVVLACAEPGTLGPLRDVLAGELLAAAGPGLRLAVAVNGVVAETCGLTDLDGYTFAGAPAAALGVTSAAVSRDEATGVVRWDFGEIGLDGTPGRLRVVTDTARSGLDVEWSGEAGVLTGALRDRCGDDGTAAVSGTLALQHEGLRDAIAFGGDAPYAGLAWALPPGRLPVAGVVRWSRDDDPRAITLDDAGDAEVGAWPGRARGPGWGADIVLDPGL
ncbi:MAG: hypothetical protein RLZZ299_2218 [Pseudomonadota bacterium]|jgi:hypothetical protein